MINLIVLTRKYLALNLLQESGRQPTTSDGEYVIDLLPQSPEDGRNQLPIEFAHLHVKAIHEESVEEELNDFFPRFTIATFRYSTKGQVSQPISVK